MDIFQIDDDYDMDDDYAEDDDYEGYDDGRSKTLKEFRKSYGRKMIH